MPRISAPTVTEHREQRRQALLDAARAIVTETRAAPTLAATAERAGLARSSIYRYFSSSDELLAAVVADTFPTWADRVRTRVEAATTPGEKVWAYIVANLDLFSSSEQHLASALREVVDPDQLRGPVETFHADLQKPLVAALTAHGEPRPTLVAVTIEGALVQVARGLGSPPDAPLVADEALAVLRRLFGGYLDLD